MIVLFDIDSTLVSIEGLDVLAARKGMGPDIKAITDATMDGTMPFDIAFPRKLATLSPTPEDLARLSDYYLDYIVSGMQELIHDLKAQGHRVGIITYNYHSVAQGLADHLELDDDLIFGNKLIAQGDHRVVDPESLLLYEDGKARIIADLKKHNPDSFIVFVGDSVGDMKTQGVADQFVGCGIVCVRQRVQSQARYFVATVAELRVLLGLE